MEDFEIIYEKDKVFGDYLICKHCGERVERGMAFEGSMVTVTYHRMHCLKRTDGHTLSPTGAKQIKAWKPNLFQRFAYWIGIMKDPRYYGKNIDWGLQDEVGNTSSKYWQVTPPKRNTKTNKQNEKKGIY